MKVKTTIKYRSNFMGRLQSDSKVLDVESKKQAYQIAYGLYLKWRKSYPGLCFAGIEMKII